MMDNGEIEFSDHHEGFLSDDIAGSASMDTFLDDILKNTHSCTHTHSCNPPGPDNTHTHTCFHTHTKLFAPVREDEEEEDPANLAEPNTPSITSSGSKKRPLGNREAVRKYREKKKAHAVHLEEEVRQLRVINEQLLRKLQGQAILEAEVARLRTLLSEFRRRIDAEMGFLSDTQQPAPPVPPIPSNHHLESSKVQTDNGEEFVQYLPGGYFLNSVNLPCDADVPCLHASLKQTPLSREEKSRGIGLCGLSVTGPCPVMGSDNQDNSAIIEGLSPSQVSLSGRFSPSSG